MATIYDVQKSVQELTDEYRKTLVDYIESLGFIAPKDVVIKRDLGDSVDFVEIDYIDNGRIYYKPTDEHPYGFGESLVSLSMNEMYDIIMKLK